MRKTCAWPWATLPALLTAILCLPGRARAEEHRHWEEHDRGSVRYASRDWHREREVHYHHGGTIRYERPERFFRVPGRYERDYFRRFRPGYRTLMIGPNPYYYYPVLPPGYQTVLVRGQPYYVYEGIYYQPYLYQGGTIYVVVPPPPP